MNNNLSYKEFIERHERERREYAKRHGLDYNSYYHIKPPAEEEAEADGEKTARVNAQRPGRAVREEKPSAEYAGYEEEAQEDVDFEVEEESGEEEAASRYEAPEDEVPEEEPEEEAPEA